jgi:hypothetical protein
MRKARYYVGEQLGVESERICFYIIPSRILKPSEVHERGGSRAI